MVTFFASPHESGEVDQDQECPDYHPLNRDEIQELVEMALTDPCPQSQARLRVRLRQGIVGMTCPEPGPDSPLFDLAAEVDGLYDELIQRERKLDQLLVDELDELLNWS